MTPDLQKKIDLEANKDSVIRDTYIDSSFTAKNAFKKGASFVTGILQPEIDRLTHLSDGRFHQIQSLKDENKRFREAMKYVLDNMIAHYSVHKCPHCEIRIDSAKEALSPQKKEVSE